MAPQQRQKNPHPNQPLQLGVDNDTHEAAVSSDDDDDRDEEIPMHKPYNPKDHSRLYSPLSSSSRKLRTSSNARRSTRSTWLDTRHQLYSSSHPSSSNLVPSENRRHTYGNIVGKGLYPAQGVDAAGRRTPLQRVTAQISLLVEAMKGGDDVYEVPISQDSDDRDVVAIHDEQAEVIRNNSLSQETNDIKSEPHRDDREIHAKDDESESEIGGSDQSDGSEHQSDSGNQSESEESLFVRDNRMSDEGDSRPVSRDRFPQSDAIAQTTYALTRELVGDEEEGSEGSMEADTKDDWNQAELFEPPRFPDNLFAHLATGMLELAMKDMRYTAWTSNGAYWEDIMVSQKKVDNQTRKEMMSKHSKEEVDRRLWYQEHKRDLKTSSCQKLGRAIYDLWRCFRNTPTIADAKKQAQFLCAEKNLTIIRSRLGRVRSHADEISSGFAALTSTSSELDAGRRLWATQTAVSLRRIVIPFMFLALKELVIAGSLQSREERLNSSDPYEIPTKATAKYSIPILKTMLRIIGLIQTLHHVMMLEQQKNESNEHQLHKHLRMRGLTGRHLQNFEADIEKALRRLEVSANSPQDRRNAADKDRHVKEMREKAQRIKEEEMDRQTKLYLASTQRTTLSSSQRGMRHSSQVRPARSESVARMTRKRSSSRISAKEDYQAKNNGWSWDQDNELLTAIRGESRPDKGALAQLTGKDVADVMVRIRDLKRKALSSYKETGQEPPRWCYP